MGLDMYLEARRYVSQHDWVDGESKATRDFMTIASLGPDGLTQYADFSGATVALPVGYWRKANAIHGWFVQNVQGGVDDCREAYVSREQLIALRDACMSVASVPAGSVEAAADASGLLPQSGFFFGSTEIDEWYMSDLKRTIDIIDNILSLIPEDSWEWSFYYHSSW